MSEAYDAAIHLARGGAAFFTAPFVGWGKGSGGCGYQLPADWQRSAPGAGEAAIRAWNKGDALCMLGGHLVDVVDFDPRNGSGPARQMWRENGWDRIAIATATTPNGGEHLFIPATGLRKAQNVWPGVDHQAGAVDGGTGFAFVAPTRKLAKTTGKVAGYTWTSAPNLEEIDTTSMEYEDVLSALRERAQVLAPAEALPYEGLRDFADLPPVAQSRIGAYVDAILARCLEELAAAHSWPVGYAQKRTVGDPRGWEKVTADAFLNGARIGLDPRTPYDLETVRDLLVPAAPVDENWTARDVRAKWNSQVRAARRIGAME